MIKRMVEYSGKICLAPMVRSGELPMRLMALKYGCDLVWTPELIDRKLVNTIRTVNRELGTIDYVESGNTNSVAFRKHPSETGKLILQLGSATPDLAVEAANKVIEDVDGIDLNCGCPKHFSTHGGMGAKLLDAPDILCSILTNLVNKVGIPNNKPISCKIRLLPEFEKTKELIERICETGIKNLTIHCRTPIMRNRQDPFWNYLPKLIPIIQSKGVSVIINGNIQGVKDLHNLQMAMENDKLGIMIAEAAETNPSVFSLQPKSQKEVACELFDFALKYHPFSGTKYFLQNMIPGKSPYYSLVVRLKTYEQLQEVIDKLRQDGDDVWMNTIANRNLQKHHSMTLEEYNLHMDARGEVMKQFAGNWNEDEMLKPLNDRPTKRTQEIPQHKKQQFKKIKSDLVAPPTELVKDIAPVVAAATTT